MNGNAWCDRHGTGYPIATGCVDCNAIRLERVRARTSQLELTPVSETTPAGFHRRSYDAYAAAAPKVYTRGQLEVLVAAPTKEARVEIMRALMGFGFTLSEIVRLRRDERVQIILDRQGRRL